MLTELANNKHTFVVAVSVGKGLGRIKHVRKSWRKLQKDFAAPLRDTSCTFAQYQAMSQDEKLEKKRAPGSWTPSRYKGNRRAVVDLEEKTLLVYDLDHVTHDQLDWIRQGLAPISRYEWIMHTSRSHSPEEPRVRMILPISRPMKPDEANAVFRFIAQELADDPEEGIEIPDLVSFRGNQTMFWPSVSKDQEFWTNRNVGEIVDVDAVLAANPGWENYENLPYQVAETKKGITDPNKRMEDPYQKPEPIGAWCRSYTVQEVIENFLSDIYVPGDSETEERYTYLPGSGANGAVVYEGGKFLHSNHGTDPVDTANAFDLLRLHKFGHLDAEAHHNTTPGNMPSFKKMAEFARKDERVVADLWSDHDASLDDLEDDVSSRDTSEPSESDEDLEDLLGEEPESDDPLGDHLDDLDDDEDEGSKPGEKKKDSPWQLALQMQKGSDKELKPIQANITVICENDPRIKDSVGYNEFTRDPICFKPIKAKQFHTPSPEVAKRDRKRGRRWETADDVSIGLIASHKREMGGYGVDFSNEKIQQAVLTAGTKNAINPVKDDIEECWRRWKAEGSPTGLLDTYVSDFLKTPDTPFHRQTGALFLLGSVARTFEPGCKFDQMPIIEGKTGSGKSLFFKVLFGDEYVGEMDESLDNTGRLVEAMRGRRCIELAEMDAAKKSENNTLKRAALDRQRPLPHGLRAARGGLPAPVRLGGHLERRRLPDRSHLEPPLLGLALAADPDEPDRQPGDGGGPPPPLGRSLPAVSRHARGPAARQPRPRHPGPGGHRRAGGDQRGQPEAHGHRTPGRRDRGLARPDGADARGRGHRRCGARRRRPGGERRDADGPQHGHGAHGLPGAAQRPAHQQAVPADDNHALREGHRPPRVARNRGGAASRHPSGLVRAAGGRASLDTGVRGRGGRRSRS